jgi:hypothetical protein
LPEKLNLAGIIRLMAQILGVTWQAIRAQVVKKVGPMAEKVMDQVEKSVAWVGNLITKGPIALMDMAKEFLGELQALFFDAFIGWLRNTVIVRAVEKLISMFNPVGAIVQAVMTIYNMVQFFIERAKQIAALVNAVFSSIAEIAGGNIKKAVAAVEDSLVKALPVAISFLANLVGIGGITAKIKEIIQKIRKPIDAAVGKAVGFIAGKAKGLIGKELVNGIRYTPMDKGPLPEAIAKTFRSASYIQTVTKEETVLYRVYGGKVGRLGSFWTKSPPNGPVQSIIDSALDPSWGNTATQVVKMKVPKGVTIYEGYAASQKGLVGGGSQIYIERINLSWIIE